MNRAAYTPAIPAVAVAVAAASVAIDAAAADAAAAAVVHAHSTNRAATGQSAGDASVTRNMYCVGSYCTPCHQFAPCPTHHARSCAPPDLRTL